MHKSHLTLAASALSASGILFSGCGDDFARKVEAAATVERWRSWAVQIAEHYAGSQAESGPILVSPDDYPEFLRRIPAPNSEWIVYLLGSTSNDCPRISVRSLGGFGSTGIEIGSTNFVDVTQFPARIRKIYPGIYVRRVY